jgi:hypothetical protein
MELEVLPPTGELIPDQESPLSPVVVQEETLVALQLTWVVVVRFTRDGMAVSVSRRCCRCRLGIDRMVVAQRWRQRSQRRGLPSLS